MHSLPPSRPDGLDDRPVTPLLMLAWRCDRHGACDFVNEGWISLTGCAFDDALGEGWLRAIHPDDRPDVTTARRAALRRQGPFEVAYRMRHHDYSYRLMLERGTPRFDTEGVFQGLVGSTVDITDRLDAVTRVAAASRDLTSATTVCTACNKVHARDGTWQQLDAWLHHGFDSALERGLCPDCEARWERGA